MEAADVFIHPTAVVDSGCQIGKGSKIWHFCHLLAGAQLGPDCILGQNVMLGQGVSLGAGVKVQNNVSVYAGVTVEDQAFLGPSCVFTNILNPRSFVERKAAFLPTHVGYGATVGANATILCGNALGAYCLVGAGAVVTRDVPPHGLVLGNPGRLVGWVSRQGHRLHFDEQGQAWCQEEACHYRLTENKVTLEE